MESRILFLLGVFLLGGLLCLYKPTIIGVTAVLFPGPVCYAMGCMSDYVLIAQRGSRLGIKFDAPDLDKPLFQGGRTIQGDFDVALATVVFGIGGLFWIAVLSHRFSNESALAIAWGLGALHGIKLYSNK